MAKEKKDVEEEFKEENEVKEEPKSKKGLIIIIIVCLLIIGALIFIYFKFLKSSDKTIVYYRYQDKLFLKDGSKSWNSVDYTKDLKETNFKEYTYQCRYDYCHPYTLEYQKSGFDNSINGTWVLIYDMNKKDEHPLERCAREDSEYVLYNVETKQKYVFPIKEEICITDVLVDSEGNPKGLTALQYGTTVSHYVVDVNTGNIIFNTDDTIYSGTEDYERDIKVVNTGKKDLYMVEPRDDSNMFLYDENFNFINDIASPDYFDPNGNIIKVTRDVKGQKDQFFIYDLEGKIIHSSKKYDEVFVDNGYIIVRDDNKISIVDSNENKIVDISSEAKKYEYTTYYNKYAPKKGHVSILEFKDGSNEYSGTFYRYNIKENKLDKEKSEFDNVDALVALSRYYVNGYTKYKIKNTTVYVDNELSDKKKEELKGKLETLSNEKVTKKMFEAKQNIYLFTEYDYAAYNVRAYRDRIYRPEAIPVNDNTPIFRIVKKISYNYFADHSEKLRNNSFKKLYDKYYKYLDDSNAHAYDEEYYEIGFFGNIMAAYKYEEVKYDWNTVDWQLKNFLDKIERDGKLEEFNKEVKKYIESYVSK